jgi:predicted kinase
MSGLPGAGKDTWLRRHAPELPVISLDAIRKEIGAPPTGKQGPVFTLAKERAREWMRQRRDFAWNATNLSRETRTRLIELFASYNARIRIVYVEASAPTLELQNRNRESAVPAGAVAAMMDRWELPSPIEADEVQWWIDGILQNQVRENQASPPPQN